MTSVLKLPGFCKNTGSFRSWFLERKICSLLFAMSEKKRKRVLSLEQKVKILNAVQASTGTKNDIAKEFDIPKSTLSTILKNREKILAACGTKKFNRSRQRVRESRWPLLDKAVLKWLREARSKNLPVSGPLLKEKADGLALKLGIEDFKKSDGWLSRFKRRYQLSVKSVSGEAGAVSKEACETWAERLKDLLKSYSPDDVFNADETGIFYKAMPNKTIAFRNEVCTGGKMSKDRLTVMVCANMSGTQKLKLLVIGKYKNPRCFKGIRSLPTDYRHNKKAWILSNLFEEWIRQLDRKFLLEKRKVLLILDNCSAHVHIKGLQALQLEFLPPNTTSLLQPMDQGVIKNLKLHYRHSLMRRILLCMEHGKLYEVDVLKAIHFLYLAWTEVSEVTIKNCFRHAGFYAALEGDSSLVPNEEVQDAQIQDELTEVVEALKEKEYPFPEGFCVEDFVNLDNEVLVCSGSSDNEIVEAVQAECQIAEVSSKEDSDSENDDNTEPKKPTKTEVFTAIEVLQNYFALEEDAESNLCHLQKLERSVIQTYASGRKAKQPIITSFFKPS